MQLLISLSSFGAAEVGRHGQLWCTELARQAGADGVEVRGEMLRDAATELPALVGRAAVFSSPEGLWTMDGALEGTDNESFPKPTERRSKPHSQRV